LCASAQRALLAISQYIVMFSVPAHRLGGTHPGRTRQERQGDGLGPSQRRAHHRLDICSQFGASNGVATERDRNEASNDTPRANLHSKRKPAGDDNLDHRRSQS
jgi:hypothetical protein